MDNITSIATGCTVPFRTRELQGAEPTLAPAHAPGQGTGVSVAGMKDGVVFGADRIAGAPDLTGDPSASSSASPL